MRRASGAILLEAVIALFLLFTAGISLLGLLQSSDQAYHQAAQAQLALRLAHEGLELARVQPQAGKLALKPVSLLSGQRALEYHPEVEMLTRDQVLLVISRVRWSDGRRSHQVELKTYVAP